jgi:hypothetical protein
MILSVDTLAPEVVSFLTGLASCIAIFFAYCKRNGVKLLPEMPPGITLDDALRQIQQQLNENDRAEAEFKKQIMEALNNISLIELAEILAVAQKYGEDGYTKAEAEDIGMRIIRAARSKEDDLQGA